MTMMQTLRDKLAAAWTPVPGAATKDAQINALTENELRQLLLYVYTGDRWVVTDNCARRCPNSGGGLILKSDLGGYYVCSPGTADEVIAEFGGPRG